MCRCNTNAFTHRRSYAETLYTETFWHTDVFTHTHALALIHRRFYIQTLLHTDAFTHRGVYTEAVSRTEMHRNLYTRTLLRTYALTQQNLHKVLPGTTSYYCVRREEGARGGQQGGAKEGGGRPSTTCTTKFAEKCQYYPVLLCIAKFGQITSSTTCYFVFQSLQKVFPSTILRTIKLVQEARRGESGRGATSTTSYYKVCTK